MTEGSAGHRGWLRREVEAWVREGLVSASQASAIFNRYPSEEAAAVKSQTQKRIAVVFAVLGAVLIGLGVILFFADNWQAISKWAKFTLLLAATAGAYGLGYWLRFSRGYPAVGSALILLGGLLYGAGIFLVGQMFHVQAEPHYGLLMWAAGLLPLAYTLPATALITLAAVLVVVWVGMVSLLGPDFGNPIYTIQNLIAAGVILYGIGRLHGVRERISRLGRPHLITGALVTLLAYFLYTLPALLGGGDPVPPSSLIVLRGALLTGAVASLLGVVTLAPDRRRAVAEAAGLGILLLWIWVIPPLASWLYAEGLRFGWGWILLNNMLLFGLCLGTAALGVDRNERALVNIGLVFFALGVAARYIDIIGRLLTTSLFFIGGGVLLLGGGWLIERTRRRLLQRMGAMADVS